MSWKVNSERIAKRHNIQTFDKLTYEQAKEIGFCYCVPYTNKEASKEYAKGATAEVDYNFEKWNHGPS